MKSKCNSMSLAALPADPPNQNHCNMKKNMKTSIINLLLLPALIAGLNLIPAGRVTAQTFKPCMFHLPQRRSQSVFRIDFIGQHPLWDGESRRQCGRKSWHISPSTPMAQALRTCIVLRLSILIYYYTNSDGYVPFAGSILSSNTLYGAAPVVIPSQQCLPSTPIGLRLLQSVKVDTSPSGLKNSRRKTTLLVRAVAFISNALYGRPPTRLANGTLFAINTITVLHTFNFTDGASPSGLILSGNALYGTGLNGGRMAMARYSRSTSMAPGFTNLHTFHGSWLWPFKRSFVLIPTATEKILAICFYRATPCMGRRQRAEPMAVARCSAQYRWHGFYESV